MNDINAASKILMYHVAVSIPVKITTLVAPLADMPGIASQYINFGRMLRPADHPRWFPVCDTLFCDVHRTKSVHNYE
jgi:hypothetical protein